MNEKCRSGSDTANLITRLRLIPYAMPQAAFKDILTRS